MNRRTQKLVLTFLKMGLRLPFFSFLATLVFSSLVFAMNGKTTYQAKIVKPDGYPLEAPVVNFKFTVLDAAASCVLYSENYSNVDMRSTGGLISFALGNGVRDFPVSGTTAIFANVFDNSINSMPCQAPGIYNPQPSDSRRVVMQFNDSSGWQTLPAMTINAVPYAMYADKANVATTLNNKADTAFVEYSTLASLNCNSVTEAITFNGVNFSCIPVGAASGSGISSVTTSGSVLVTGGTASAPVISIQAATFSQDGYLTSLDYAEFKAKLSASSTEIINTLGYAPVSSSTVASQIASATLAGDVSGNPGSNTVNTVGGKTSSQISTSVDDTLAATTSATANTLVRRDSSGNVLAAGLSATTANLNYVDIYKPSSSFNVRLQAPTSLSSNYILNLPTASGTIGQVLSTDGNGNLSWINPSTGSVTSVSATAPLASTGGSTPTLSITQATSSTDGYLSAADWAMFNNKQQATSSAIIATLGYTPADNAASGTFVQKNGDTMAGTLAFVIGTATNAPLKFTSGTLLSSAQSGTVEYDGSQLYFTDGSNIRRALATNSSPGSFDNTSSISNTSGNITLSPNNITGSVIVNSSQASISSGTGALVVNGGVGIAGSINAGGNLNLTGAATIGQSLTLSSLTSGSLLFAGASGLVSEDNSKLFWDGANQRLGLGTNVPAQTLSVSGASYFSGNVGIGTSNPGTKFQVVGTSPSDPNGGQISAVGSETTGAQGTGGGIGFYGHDGSIGRGWASIHGLKENSAVGDVASYLAFSTRQSGNATAEKMRISSTGNVGIGTSPEAKLHVEATDGQHFKYSQLGATKWDGGAYADNTFRINESGIADRFVIKSGGNVGIGTTAPSSNLSVQAVSGASIKITNTNGRTVGDKVSLKFAIDLAENTVASIYSDNTGGGNGASAIGFSTWDGSTTSEKMRISASGNIGVGTATPATSLDIQTNSLSPYRYGQQRLWYANSNQQLWLGSVADTVGSYIGNNSRYINSFQFEPNYTQASGLNFRQDGSTEFWNDSGLTVGVSYTPTKRMVITNAGNVGVGITAPTAKLQITAGTSTVAAMKLTSGTLLSSPQSGTIEYDGFNFYVTDGANSRRSIATVQSEGSFDNTNTISNGSGNITLAPNNAAGSVIVSATTASTNSNTGALIVKGGVGVVGNLNVSGSISTLTDLNVAGSLRSGHETTRSFTRTLPTNLNEAVDIGSFVFTQGGGMLVVGVTVPSSGFSVSKEYLLPVKFSQTSGAWVKSLPIASTGSYAGNDFELDINVATNNTILRLRRTLGITAGIAYITVKHVGNSADIFTSSNSVALVSAPLNLFTSSALTQVDGNVGIGSLTPTSRLEVIGTATIYNPTGSSYNENLRLPSSNIGYSAIALGSSATQTTGTVSGQWTLVKFPSAQNNLFTIRHREDDHFAITPEGNVGIGTTTPGIALPAAAKSLTVMGSGNESLIELGRTDTVSDGTRIGQYDWTVESNTAGRQMLAIVGDVEGNTANNRGADMLFFTKADAGLISEKMRINSIGNVGIGTTVPLSVLHVNGVSSSLMRWQRSGPSASNTFGFEANNVGMGLYNYTTANYGWWLANDGNLGLGTAGPAAKLNVVQAATGRIALLESNATLNAFAGREVEIQGRGSGTTLHAETQGSGVAATIWNNNAGNTNPALSVIQSGTGPGAVFSGGNVGIGTTAPWSILNISKTIDNGTSPATDISDYNGSYVVIHNQDLPGTGNKTGLFFAHAGSPGVLSGIGSTKSNGTWGTSLSFYTNNLTGAPSTGVIQEKMRIDPNGNVGIGTGSPDGYVDIFKKFVSPFSPSDSSLTIGDATNYSVPSDSNMSGSIMFRGNNAVHGFLTYQPNQANGRHVFKLTGYGGAYGSHGVDLSVTGNVGIGTVAPSQKLHVVGDARIQGTVTDCYIGNGSGGTSCSSDERLKENVKPIPYALDKINSLRGVEFEWNALSKSFGRKDIGVIAQDVEKVFSTAVITGDDGYKKVDYAVLVAPLIQAVKELYNLVLGEQARNVKQDRQIASFAESKADRIEIEKLKAENEELRAYLCAKDPNAVICHK